MTVVTTYLLTYLLLVKISLNAAEVKRAKKVIAKGHSPLQELKLKSFLQQNNNCAHFTAVQMSNFTSRGRGYLKYRTETVSHHLQAFLLLALHSI